MLRQISTVVLSLACIVTASCGSHHVDTSAQAFIESMAKQNPDVLRLTLHAIPEGGDSYHAIASSNADKLGKPSDPEDLKAMESGETIVLDEDGAIDVTVPIHMRDGKHRAAAGVTMASKVGREAAITEAKRLAAMIDRDLLDILRGK